MNVHLPAPRSWPARLVNLAVVVVVLALAAATFVLSYSGVHEIALASGVSARLARVYPATFDALLVIGCAAAVTLRDARWWARGYAWLVIIAVIGAVGAADAVHAMKVALPHKQMEGVVAAAPLVLVLLGFSLMLTMLRHSRAQHGAAAGAPPARRTGRRRAAKRDAAKRKDEHVTLAPTAAAAIGPATPALPAATSGNHAATLAAPAFAEHETDVEDGQDDTSEATQSAPFQFSAVATEAAWPTGHAAAEEDWEAGHVTDTEPRELAAPVWLERVADSGEPAQYDYWEAEEDSGQSQTRDRADSDSEDAPTAPRLNRVRATPVPPEEDED